MEYNVYDKRTPDEKINLKNVVIGIGLKDKIESLVVLEHVGKGTFKDIETVREIDKVSEVRRLSEIFKEFKQFFDNTKSLSYNDELVRIREICNSYQPLFEALDNGEDIYLSFYELNCMINTLKRMYYYSFGGPISQSARIEVPDKKLRNPNETVDLERLYIASAKRKNNGIYTKEGIILELVGPYIHDDNLLIYRNTETEDYYYVNAKNEVVKTSDKAASIDIESFSGFRGVIACLKSAYNNTDKFNEEDTTAMELFASMEGNLAQVREINQNKRFLFRSYHILNCTATPKRDYKPSIVENFKELDKLLTTLEVFSSNKAKRYSIY